MNSEEFPLQEDFQHWKRGGRFCFCHYPFVFEAASKAVLLDIENQGEQVCLLGALLPAKLCFRSLRTRAGQVPCHGYPAGAISCCEQDHGFEPVLH